MKYIPFPVCAVLLLILGVTTCWAQVSIVSDEAEAVLAILSKQSGAAPVTETDWQRLFASEGYVRLKAREAALKRSFTDEEFRAFVLSDRPGAQRQALAETLARWQRADLVRAEGLARAYLPASARIRAKIYPVIKPRENSFVFDVKSDPAIFLYLDPAVGREKFENTLAHELHHIGFGSSCPSPGIERAIERLPAEAQTVLNWIAAFGEGFAMLAAAGGRDIHPHAVSTAEERARWDQDLGKFNEDLRTVERFFVGILEKRLTNEEIQQTASSFYGVQGLWYTVGWQMSVVIEQAYGRAELIECMCDQRKLLATYNRAVTKLRRQSGRSLASWSTVLINGIKGKSSAGDRRERARAEEPSWSAAACRRFSLAVPRA